jgi:hypothetical protein
MLSTPQSVQAWTCYPPQLLTDSSNWAFSLQTALST